MNEQDVFQDSKCVVHFLRPVIALQPGHHVVFGFYMALADFSGHAGQPLQSVC